MTTARELGELPAYPVKFEGAEYSGLTKREAFAMAAMQGMAMRVISIQDHEVASAAIWLADALLAELAKAQP